MEIYRPLQRADGRWDFTLSNSVGVMPIGFCMALGAKPFYSLPYSEVGEVVRGLFTEERWEREKAQYAPHLHRYHDDGHATSREACHCYRLYEVLLHSDRHIEPDEQKKCALCGVWTQRRVMVGRGYPHEYVLCGCCDNEDNVLALHVERHK